MATRRIEVIGPDAAGAFMTILPDGTTRWVATAAELDVLMREWAVPVLVTKGDGTLKDRRKPG